MRGDGVTEIYIYIPICIYNLQSKSLLLKPAASRQQQGRRLKRRMRAGFFIGRGAPKNNDDDGLHIIN
jgi:hypothetical protein